MDPWGDTSMIRITTLVDNHALPGTELEAEHGFSCLVEAGGKNVLFDTGGDDLFIRNARKLGIDLGSLDHLAISHGHWDHAGGVVPLLEQFSHGHLMMWTGKGFEDPKYSDDPDGMRFTGFGFDRKFVESHHVTWHAVCSDTVMIEPGIWLVSSFDPIHPMEVPNPKFLVKRSKPELVPDDFSDEIAMVLDSPQGLVMITGCSHPGILNMIDAVDARFSKPLYALIGGIHLYDATPERRKVVTKGLADRAITLLGVSHCTGEEASGMLETSYPGYFANLAGTVTVI